MKEKAGWGENKRRWEEETERVPGKKKRGREDRVDRRYELGNKYLDKSKNELVEPSWNDGEAVKGGSQGGQKLRRKRKIKPSGRGSWEASEVRRTQSNRY